MTLYFNIQKLQIPVIRSITNLWCRIVSFLPFYCPIFSNIYSLHTTVWWFSCIWRFFLKIIFHHSFPNLCKSISIILMILWCDLIHFQFKWLVRQKEGIIYQKCTYMHWYITYNVQYLIWYSANDMLHLPQWSLHNTLIST